MINVNLLIPGHLYRDDKGVELIYVGVGNYERDEYPTRTNGLYSWRCCAPSETRYLYIKKADLDKKLADGRLNAAFTQYDGTRKDGCHTDFGSTVFFSKKPRSLMVDLGAVYPENFFQNRVIVDHTNTMLYGWYIHTI
jgi:hypothetical protein